MVTVFEKIFFASAELGRMQEFLEFTKNVHKISNCKQADCEIEKFMNELDVKISNEELSYDERRMFFTETCMNQVPAFNVMFNLHAKGKENVQKMEDLIKDAPDFLKNQRERPNELSKLTREKYLIQRKMDAIIENLFLNQ